MSNVTKVREFTKEKASNPEFVHHQWFVKWHLEVVESIAEGLLQHYPHADKDLVRVMVWMHDYGKIIDFDSQYSHDHVDSGRVELVKLGFSESFAGKAAEGIKILDAKVDLKNSPLEVQILSSADGCSHLVGPFIRLYWWENPDKPYEEIMTENIRKLTLDWEKKVVLPEARRMFQLRHDIAKEQSGEVLDNFNVTEDLSVDSVSFYVNSIAESVTFYTEKLGLKLGYRQGDDYASFSLGGISRA